MLTVIGMMGAITGGTQDAITQIDIPQSGVIRAIEWDGFADLDADAENVSAELSFIATNQISASEVRGRISSISALVTVLTAVGGHVSSLQKWISPFELAVAGGERLFMHVESSVGVTGVIHCNIHFDGGAVVTRRSARR